MNQKAPSAAELVVLQLLWDCGPLTVPELHERICETKTVAYTTVQKRVQRMEEKGLVKRQTKAKRALTYRADYNPETARSNVLNAVLSSTFGNSPNALIQRAIEEHPLSKSEISEIRALLDALEKAQD